MITKKWFAFIIFLSYLLISIIAAFLLYLKFQTAVIMSFLEITVPPSVPAFLAIFLSQYSAQAEDTRKGERLKDIQIKKEMSESLIKHYQDVSSQVNILRRATKDYVNPKSDGVHIEKLNTEYINDPFPTNVKKAILHVEGEFNTKTPKFLENFRNSEKRVDVLNNEIENLKNRVLNNLHQQNGNTNIDVAISFDNREESKNEIFGEEVFIFAYDVWSHKEQYNKTIQELRKYFDKLKKDIRGNISSSIFYKIDTESQSAINLEQNSVEWNKGTKLAYIDSIIIGVDVIELLLNLLQTLNYRVECEKIEMYKEEIYNYRVDFYNKLEKIQSRIKNNELLAVVDCCPFHEDKEYIYSYFEKTGLY